MMQFCDPSDWPEAFREMRMIDSLLRCPICYEFFNCTMILPQCSHNYCSICIRRHLSFRQDCPTCQRTTEEAELTNNRILDDFVRLFIASRKKVLAAAIQHQDSPAVVTAGNTDTEEMPAACAEQLEAETCHSTQEHQDEAACPICGKLVKLVKMNVHLDQCLLKNDEQEFSQSRASPKKRKPLPKLVYHLMKENEIKVRLKEWGLSTDGERQTLVRRHHDFTLLYNSECDSLNPRPVIDIRRQVERQEKQRIRPKVALSQPPPSTTASSGSAYAQCKVYGQAHKDQFAQLMQQARKTQLAAKELAAKTNTLPAAQSQPTVQSLWGGASSIHEEAKGCHDSPPVATGILQPALPQHGGRSKQKRSSIQSYFIAKGSGKKRPCMPPGACAAASHTMLEQTSVAADGSTFSDDSSDDALFMNLPEPVLTSAYHSERGRASSTHSTTSSACCGSQPFQQECASDAQIPDSSLSDKGAAPIVADSDGPCDACVATTGNPGLQKSPASESTAASDEECIYETPHTSPTVPQEDTVDINISDVSEADSRSDCVATANVSEEA